MIFAGEIWKNSGHWTREIVEYFKWGLTTHLISSMGNSHVEGGVNQAGLAQEISDRKNITG